MSKRKKDENEPANVDPDDDFNPEDHHDETKEPDTMIDHAAGMFESAIQNLNVVGEGGGGHDADHHDDYPYHEHEEHVDDDHILEQAAGMIETAYQTFTGKVTGEDEKKAAEVKQKEEQVQAQKMKKKKKKKKCSIL